MPSLGSWTPEPSGSASPSAFALAFGSVSDSDCSSASLQIAKVNQNDVRPLFHSNLASGGKG